MTSDPLALDPSPEVVDGVKGDSARQRVRFRRFLLTASTYGLCVPLVGLAWAMGFMSATGAGATLATMAVVNAGIWAIFASGANLRFADPSLTWLQIGAATLATMVGYYSLDVERALALALYPVVLVLGIFRFSTRQFLAAAGLLLVALAVTIALLAATKASTNLPVEAFRFVVIGCLLVGFAIAGGLIGELRLRLRRTNRDLNAALATIGRLASHDGLTGLPNRASFDERLARVVARRAGDTAKAAVFFVDLDHFKTVNDTLGHSRGDDVLREAASRLAACVRATDVSARQGGDEFVLLVDAYADRAALVDIAERVVAAFRVPMAVGGREVTITASVGVACWPEDGASAQALLTAADAAMYRAKERGRDGYAFASG